MTPERRNTYTRCRCSYIRVHNLLCFMKHLHFFFRVIVGSHLVYLWNNVVSQLMREFLNGADAPLFHNFLILLLQFFHCCCTSTRCTLVACYTHSANTAQLVNGVKHSNHHNSGAVWIGYYAARMDESILRINLRDNQRHIIFHTKLAGIINHYCPVLCNRIGKFG